MVIVSGAESASIDLGDAMLAPEPTLDGLRVLLVDDDADTREAISAVLKECGAEVSAFACAPEALAALRREVPDVLVSDIAMPGMDGHLLMRRIRELAAERGGSIPAIAPGSESGKRSDDRRGAARGTRAGSWSPQEGGASTPLAAPGSFAAAAMTTRTASYDTERCAASAAAAGRGRAPAFGQARPICRAMSHR